MTDVAWVCGRPAVEHFDLPDTRAALDAERDARRAWWPTTRCGTGRCALGTCSHHLHAWRFALVERAYLAADPFPDATDDELVASWCGRAVGVIAPGVDRAGARVGGEMLRRGLVAFVDPGWPARLTPRGVAVVERRAAAERGTLF